MNTHGQQHEATSASGSASNRARRAVVLAFCLVFLAVQIAIPLAMLPRPGVSKFGWQMYSGLAERHYQVLLDDGNTEWIPLGDHVVKHRLDIEYGPDLPPLLCRQISGAAAIVVTESTGRPAESFPCPAQ